jgi:predicted TIM-barrel fold metal-dependent hydrolase
MRLARYWVGAGFWCLAVAGTAAAGPAYIIDTHAHFDVRAGIRSGIAAALDAMPRHGIGRTVIMSPPLPAGFLHQADSYDADVVLPAVQAYSGRIVAAGGGAVLNELIHATAPAAVTDGVRDRFRAEAERLTRLGIVGFGEIAVHHLSLRPMGPKHPYEATEADHPLLLLLADIAAAHSLPIDLHLDIVPRDMPLPDRPVFNASNPATLKADLPQFERLLDHNRTTKIIWAHAGTDPLGTRTPGLERRLLERHPNLYMSLRVGRGGPPPVLALDDALRLKPEWAALLRDFPDRFVLGSDSFFGAQDRRGPADEALDNFWRLLCDLPEDVADRIAYANAESIFRLPPMTPRPAGAASCDKRRSPP